MRIKHKTDIIFNGNQARFIYPKQEKKRDR